MSTLIQIPQGNYKRIPITMASGATNITNIFFTMKLRTDVSNNDDDALIAKEASFTHTGDAISGYVDILSTESDVPLGLYKYDMRLIYSDPGQSPKNSSQGFIEITSTSTKEP